MATSFTLSVFGNLRSGLQSSEVRELMTNLKLANSKTSRQCCRMLISLIQMLITMPLYKLKGWVVPLFRDDHDAEDKRSNASRQQLQVSLLFPNLCRLVIRGCPELRVRTGTKEYGEGSSTFYPSQNSSDVIGNSKSLKVTIDSVKCLNYVLWITELDIEYDDDVEKLEEVGEVLKISSCFSSLRILRINNCFELRCIGKGALQHLSALEELTISNCYNLTLSCDQNDRSSSPLPQTLRCLKLRRLPKVVNLPDWMQHFTSLQSLHIAYCKRPKSYPEWTRDITFRTHVETSNCPDEICIPVFRISILQYL